MISKSNFKNVNLYESFFENWILENYFRDLINVNNLFSIIIIINYDFLVKIIIVSIIFLFNMINI